MMILATELERWFFLILVGIAAIAYTIYKSEEKVDLLLRWIFTIPLIGYFKLTIEGILIKGIEERSSFSIFIGTWLLALGGLMIFIIWGNKLLSLFIDRLTQFIFSEDKRAVKTPIYSIAQAHIQKGNYKLAEEYLLNILREFPWDYQATLMLANLYYEKLNTPEKAKLLLEEWITANHKKKPQISAIRNLMADMSIRENNIEQALEYLEDIEKQAPNSQYASIAKQRRVRLIARLREASSYDKTTHKIVLPPAKPVSQLHHDSNQQILKIETKIQNLLYQLELNPEDIVLREELATIYANELGKADLAIEQIEKILSTPNLSHSLKMRYLYLLAEYSLQAQDIEKASSTLTIIAKENPSSIYTQLAPKRIYKIHSPPPTISSQHHS